MAAVRLSPLTQPVEATVSVPGSKSYTNRALVLAALTTQPVKVINPLFSDDTRAMLGCLETLGITFNSRAGFIEVIGSIDDVADRDYELNADLSGTTMRFLLSLCSILPGRQTLRGQKRLEERPIGHLVDALRQLGGKIDYSGREGFPPVAVKSSKLNPGSVKLDGSQSSQYLSALLMIAPLVGGLKIDTAGDLISRPYVDMTADIMGKFGVTVANDNYQAFEVTGGQKYECREYVVEGDISSASYFFAIAVLTGSTLTVENINPESRQADMRFLKILEDMGNQVSSDASSITLAGHKVAPVNVNMQNCPDQVQTLAVLVAFASGMTTIKGVKSLRIKETERVQAIEQELAKMGVRTSSTPDTLTIHGGRPRAARIATYNDHRTAMSFAVAGARLPGMVIEEPGVVGKTFPDFWAKLNRLGVGVTSEKS